MARNLVAPPVEQRPALPPCPARTAVLRPSLPGCAGIFFRCPRADQLTALNNSQRSTIARI
jgi:hypothetical protein